jgi:hypothetical protein
MDSLGDQTRRLNYYVEVEHNHHFPIPHSATILYSWHSIRLGADGPARFPKGHDFAHLQRVQTDSGVHQASYSMGTGVLSPESKSA